MAESNVDNDIQAIAHEFNVAIRLKGVFRFRARLWVAVQILRLARLVSGLNMVVDTSEAKRAAK